MFGYAIANQDKLSRDSYEKYRAVYCGLCRRLGELHRGIDKLTLTYDLVLLILTLSSVTNTPFEEAETRCAPHPFRPHAYMTNAYTDYAADMSVVLAYYKFLDDKNDDGGFANAIKTAVFRKEALAVNSEHPEVCQEIRRRLQELSDAERRGERNPDVPAGIFGALLGAIFAGAQAGPKTALYDFGTRLGKVIYLMDASVDLQTDLRKERYNPLIRTDFSSCEKLLELLLADCMEACNALPIGSDRDILENILLSGIWTSYERQKKEGEKRR